MAPFTATIHACVVSGVGGIRSLAPNIIDLPVDVVAFRGLDERLIGAFVPLPIHSTVLPAQNVAVSADLVGGVRAHVEQATGAWMVLSSGAAGDISTRHSRRGQSVSELDRLSELVGRIIAARRVVSLPLASRTDRQALGASALAALRESPSAPPRSRETLRQGIDLIGGLPVTGRLDVELAVVGIGELALCAVPGEPFLASARQLRTLCRDSHSATMLVGCANGYRGYLPTLDRFDVATYEVLMSPFEKGAAESLIAELGDLVRNLRSTTREPLPPRRPLDHDTVSSDAPPGSVAGA
jgi:hypothetical protein